MLLDLNKTLETLRQGLGKPTVDLSGQSFTPAQLKVIALTAKNAGGYTTFKLSNSGLTPAHIDSLVGQGVKNLIADNNPTLGADGGEKISKLAGLESCNLDYSYAGGKLSAFGVSSLVSFSMRGGTAKGTNVAECKAMMANPNLREYNVSGQWLNFDNGGCLEVAKNTRLTSINLRGCNGLDDAAALLAKNKNLRTLDISNWRSMSAAGIKSIGDIGTLTSLTMVGVQQLNVGPAVAGNPNLEVVDMNFCFNLKDEGFATAFANNRTKITSISAFSCGLTEKSVNIMLTMPNLIFVEVGENPIPSAKLLELKAFVEANQRRAGFAPMAAFAKSPTLATIYEESSEVYVPSKNDPLAAVAPEQLERTKLSTIEAAYPSFWNQHKAVMTELKETVSPEFGCNR